MRYTRALFVAAALAVTIPLAACDDVQDQGAAPFGSATTEDTAPGSSDELAAEPVDDEPADAPTKVKAKAPAKPTEAAEPETAEPEAAKPKAKANAKSDLSGIRITDIEVGKGFLVDVVDDDADRFLEVGENGVDFTGTGRTDTTMMSFYPAAVSAANRVVIKPSFWNEETGPGYCVTDTSGAALKLEPCRTGKAAQVFKVVLAGDSGLFELHGTHGVVSVNNGRITTSDDGSTALQVLPYAPE